MTPEAVLDALAADLTALFSHDRLKNSLGKDQSVRIFPQNVPIREGDDEGTEEDAPPEPYVTAHISGGKIPEETDPQTMEVVLAVCVFDTDKNRQGYRDALHLVSRICRHYAADGTVGGRFEVGRPIEWAMSDEDTHPYYFGAVALHIEAAAIRREVPEL